MIGEFDIGIERGRLEELRPDDHEWLFSAISDPEVSRYWRNRGRPPAPREFLDIVLGGVHHSAIAWAGDRRFGLLQLLGEPSDGHLDLSVLTMDRRPSWAVAAVASYLGFAFDVLGLQKVYIATTDPVRRRCASIDRFATEEGRLADHLRLDGVAHDVWLHAVRARDLEAFVSRRDRSSTVSDLSAWLDDRPWLSTDVPIIEQLDSLDASELLCMIEAVAGRSIDVGALEACVGRAELETLAARFGHPT